MLIRQSNSAGQWDRASLAGATVFVLLGCTGVDVEVNDPAASSLTGTSPSTPVAPSNNPADPVVPPAGPPPTNAAPTISGVPQATVSAGVFYSFQPSATDSDGDQLTFQISNSPAWVSFSIETGRVSGIPASGDVGMHAGIVITVTDGQFTTALPAFSIDVSQIANGATTVSWTPPTRNTDGSALTNLAGYVIEYGTSAAALDQYIRLSNPSLSSYLVQNLSPGTYFFALKAVNSSGAESANSNVASSTVN